jgi:hypothetical protein
MGQPRHSYASAPLRKREGEGFAGTIQAFFHAVSGLPHRQDSTPEFQSGMTGTLLRLVSICGKRNQITLSCALEVTLVSVTVASHLYTARMRGTALRSPKLPVEDRPRSVHQLVCILVP